MIAGMIEGFVEIVRDGRVALVRGEWAEAIGDALFSGQGCETVGGMGRGCIQRFPLGDGNGIARRYLRGGVIRHFIKDSFWLENRPLAELSVHVHAFNSGLPVPMPLGAVWECRRGWYRGAFATREVAAVNLLEHLTPPSPPACGGGAPISPILPIPPISVLKNCGNIIRQMHDMNILHADLQVRNILVAREQIYLLDFDRARVLERVTERQRAHNLLRLRRSFEKNGLPMEQFEAIREGYGMPLPRVLDCLYRGKGAVSSFLGRRGS